MAKLVKHSDSSVTVEAEGVILKEAIEVKFDGDNFCPVVWVKLPLTAYIDTSKHKSDDLG